MFEQYLHNTIESIEIPELGVPYHGKVRTTYDIGSDRKILIATDRLSAFDLNITTIPLKGQVLNQSSLYWFNASKDICPNHVICSPDPNVLVCHKLNMLPVEVIVRGYLAGSTSTSILKMYKEGHREMYGVKFPDGMHDYQKLDMPILTPTTKAGAGDHDAPLSPLEIVEKGILDKNIWETVKKYAIELFLFGQKTALQRGLILADTKYEFGIMPDGRIAIGDELHTPDSSRFWNQATYKERLEKGIAPEALDKDVIRSWIAAKCDPYKDPLPPIPDELRLKTTNAYVSVYEQLTAQKLELPDAGISGQKRIKDAISFYLRNGA
ncbi:MAG: phosphoribosylaminoimidazolesuccinocarboxamide synthase [Alphaproteobacteria bacterium]|nr:phosphoribosylaminoimidazolesuccinocarboxamide synthase [Alphaproteobacteria bacterium]MCL2505562.1 phosphoribosylaminoimidazolesuccinocarboxamide synthase [Alphaproteobacteria bacterium]